MLAETQQPKTQKMSRGGLRVGAGRPRGSTARVLKLVRDDQHQAEAVKAVGPAGDGVRYENEVRERFRILNEFYGWFTIDLSRGDFPDMLVRDRDGRHVRIEVEVSSKSFLTHKHDPAGADLIVCWVHNWKDCPLPVMAIAGEWRNYQQLKRVTENLKTQNLKPEAAHGG